jgi:PIN domain nuclease of toxin-antitoxin system
MILDTCALIFLASGDRRLSRGVRERLSKQTARWFCAISSFEIALKYREKKLELPFPPAQWLQKMSQRYALTEVPVDSALCLAAVALPNHHRDPFDRFIIAAAKRLDVPVVTIDPRFQEYGVEIIS